MEPLRVLQVVTKMDRAGLETLLMNCYRNLDRNKLQFDFLTHRPTRGDYDDEIEKLGGRIYHLSPIHPKFFIQYLKELNDFFATHKEYQIIHSHIDSLSAFALRASKKAGIPVRIAHCHTTKFELDVKYPFRILARQMIPLYATHLFACSKGAGAFMFGKTALESDNITIVNNAIDSDVFSFSPEIRQKKRAELGISDKLVIGHIGRFIKLKNHPLLINILNSLLKQDNQAVLLLIGRGETETATRKLVEQLKIEEHVRFLGVREDIPELLQAMDVFLLPSLFEGLPVVGVEAQAAGLPCIFSDTITRDVDVTGNISFVSNNSPCSEWAEQIVSCSNRPRKNMHEVMVNAGYDIKEQAKWLEDFYLNVV